MLGQLWDNYPSGSAYVYSLLMVYGLLILLFFGDKINGLELPLRSTKTPLQLKHTQGKAKSMFTYEIMENGSRRQRIPQPMVPKKDILAPG